MIPMFLPFVSGKAIARAAAILQTTFIGAGDTVKEFEDAIEKRFGFKGLLTINGTCALRLALAIAGVGPGDEVISVSQTCTATNTPILEQYAIPQFADIQFDTGNIDPNDIEHRITEKTKAIMCVHWAGYPCDLDEIHTIAKKYNLPVIEDAAHALGARYHGQNIGAISEYTMFSFGAIKHLTTVNGGMLVVSDKDKFQEAIQRRWCGIDRDKRKPSEDWPGYYDWQQSIPGYNYVSTNVNAAIGLGNLPYFDDVFTHREKLANFYQQELASVPGLRLFQYKGDRRCAWWLFTIHVENRRAFHDMMKFKGIETSVCHVRNDIYPVFGGRRNDMPNLDKYQDTYICIPMHQGITDDNAQYIVDSIKGGW